MTTIAYRAGVLAADSSCWVGSTHTHPIKKIFRVRELMIGCCGRVSDIHAFVKWIDHSADFEEYPRLSDFEALVISPDGKVRAFEPQSPDPIPVLGAYCALGQGSDFALGAMWAGASAVDAIKAARDHNSHTHGRIQQLRLKKTGIRNAPTRPPESSPGTEIEQEQGA